MKTILEFLSILREEVSLRRAEVKRAQARRREDREREALLDDLIPTRAKNRPGYNPTANWRGVA